MKIEGCDMKMTKCPSLGDPYLNILSSKIWQEAQPADFEKRLKTTPLNASRSKVLMWIRANGVGIPVPKRLSPTKRAGADRKSYCQYHRDYGHDIDDCREL